MCQVLVGGRMGLVLFTYVMLWHSTLRDEDDTTSFIFFCEDVFRVWTSQHKPRSNYSGGILMSQRLTKLQMPSSTYPQHRMLLEHFLRRSWIPKICLVAKTVFSSEAWSPTIATTETLEKIIVGQRKMKHFCHVLEWPLLGDAWKWPDKGFVQLQKNCNRVILKRQFAAFYSLVVCEFFRQTETPWSKMTNLRAATCAIFWLSVGADDLANFLADK